MLGKSESNLVVSKNAAADEPETAQVAASESCSWPVALLNLLQRKPIVSSQCKESASLFPQGHCKVRFWSDHLLKLCGFSIRSIKAGEFIVLGQCSAAPPKDRGCSLRDRRPFPHDNIVKLSS